MFLGYYDGQRTWGGNDDMEFYVPNDRMFYRPAVAWHELPERLQVLRAE